MNLWLYIFQAILIAGVILTATRPRFLMLKLQILGWLVGVIALACLYGLEEQLGFYSNDQIVYVEVTRELLNFRWSQSLRWWVDQSKAPFTLAALPLGFVGIHETLALKTVSLLSLLALSNSLLINYSAHSSKSQLRVAYLTGCGVVGSFFSVLALRETLMMFLVYRLAKSRSPSTRLFSGILLFLLRPHLAVAVIVADLMCTVWQWLTKHRKPRIYDALLLALSGSIIGDFLYDLVYLRRSAAALTVSWDWGIEKVTRLASNYVGLQFLTNHESKLRLSVENLFLLRIVFSETVLIPTMMTFALLFLATALKRQHQVAIVAFSIYVSIATNTDFNSFRQNLPLMPWLGMVVLDLLREHRATRYVYPHIKPPMLA